MIKIASWHDNIYLFLNLVIIIIIIIEPWMSPKYTCIKLVIPTFKNKFFFLGWPLIIC